MAKEKKVAKAAAADTAPAPSKIEGVVKWFNPQKGWGFVTCADSAGGNMDVFVHQTSILTEGFRTLYEDEAVRFEAVPGKKDGTWEAKKVVVLEPSLERERRAKRAAKKAAGNGNPEADDKE